jgi:hypothetical protein
MVAALHDGCGRFRYVVLQIPISTDRSHLVSDTADQPRDQQHRQHLQARRRCLIDGVCKAGRSLAGVAAQKTQPSITQ